MSAVAAPRPDADWSATPASDRGRAGARAELAAAEAARLAGGGDAGGSGGGGLPPLAAQAASAALDRLQLTITDVHVRFEGLPDGRGGGRAAAGVVVRRVATAPAGARPAPATGSPPLRLAKDVSVEGFLLYWTPAGPAPGAPRPPAGAPPCAAADVLLGPAAATLSAAVGGGGDVTPTVRLALSIDELAASARPAALAGVAAAADAAAVWRARRDSARHCPDAWRRRDRGRVPPAALWRFAAAASLAAAGRPLRAGGALAPAAAVAPGVRTRYVNLYIKRIHALAPPKSDGDAARPPPADPAADAAALADLEAALPLDTCLALRQAAYARVEAAASGDRGGSARGPARLLSALLGRVPFGGGRALAPEDAAELEIKLSAGLVDEEEGGAVADGPPPVPPPPPPPDAPSLTATLRVSTVAISLLDAAGRPVATLELDRVRGRAAAGGAAATARAAVGRARVLSGGRAPHPLLTVAGAATTLSVNGYTLGEGDGDGDGGDGGAPPALFASLALPASAPPALRLDVGLVEARPRAAPLAALAAALAEAAPRGGPHAERAAADDAAAHASRLARALRRARAGAPPFPECRLGVADLCIVCEAGPASVAVRTGAVGVEARPPADGGAAAAAAAAALVAAADASAGRPAGPELDQLAAAADATRGASVAWRAAGVRADWASAAARGPRPLAPPLAVAGRALLGRAPGDVTDLALTLDLGGPLRAAADAEAWAALAAALAAALPPRAAPAPAPPRPSHSPAVAAAPSAPLAACAATLFAGAPPRLDLALAAPRVALSAATPAGGAASLDAGMVTLRVRMGAGGALAVDADAVALRVRDETPRAAPPPVLLPGAVPALAASLSASDAAVAFAATDAGTLLVSLDLVGLDIGAFPGDPAGGARAARLGVRSRARVTHAQRRGSPASTAVALEGLAVGGGVAGRLGALIASLVAAGAADPDPAPSTPPDALALDFAGCSVTLPASGDARDSARVSADRLTLCLPAHAPPPPPGDGSHVAVAPCFRAAMAAAGMAVGVLAAPPLSPPATAAVARVKALELHARVSGAGRRSARPRLLVVGAVAADADEPEPGPGGAISYRALAVKASSLDLTLAPGPVAAVRGAVGCAMATLVEALPPPPRRVAPKPEAPPPPPRQRLTLRLNAASASCADGAGTTAIARVRGVRVAIGAVAGDWRGAALGATLRLARPPPAAPPSAGGCASTVGPPSAPPSAPASDAGDGARGGSRPLSRVPSAASALGADLGLAAALAPPVGVMALPQRRFSQEDEGGPRRRRRAASLGPGPVAATPVRTPPRPPSPPAADAASSDSGFETAQSSACDESPPGAAGRKASPAATTPGPLPAAPRWRASSAPPVPSPSPRPPSDDEEGAVMAEVELAAVEPPPRRAARRAERAARVGATLAPPSTPGAPAKASLGPVIVSVRADGDAWSAAAAAAAACVAAADADGAAESAAAVAAAVVTPDDGEAVPISAPETHFLPLTAVAGPLTVVVAAPGAAAPRAGTPSARLVLLGATARRDEAGTWTLRLPAAEAAAWVGPRAPRAPSERGGAAAASLAAARGLVARVAPAPAPGGNLAVDVRLQAVCVWVCPARAAALAAVVTAAALRARASDPPPDRPTADPQPLPFRAGTTASLRIDRVGALFETASGTAGVPLLEAAADAVALTLAAPPTPAGTARLALALRLSARAYAASPGGWEPVLDPAWPVAASLDLARGAAGAGGGGARRALARLESAAVAELTATPAALTGVGAARAAAAAASSARSGGPALDAALDAASVSGAASARAVSVVNDTGVPASVALAPAPGAPPRRARAAPPPAPAALAVGARVSLPLSPPTDRHGAAAGPPRRALHVGEPRALAPPPRARLPPRPLALHVCLLGASKGGMLPPILLASAGDGSAVAAPGPGGVPARVGWRVGARLGGAATVALHSALRVVNRTGRALEFGLRTAIDPEPARVAAAPPGASAWLPAARPQPGLLCVRPAGYAWSAGVRLEPLLDAAAAGEATARVLSLQGGVGGGARRLSLRLGLAAPLDGAPGWDLILASPLTLINALPLPLAAALGGRGPPLALTPGAAARLDGGDAEAAASSPTLHDVVLQPAGYAKSAPASLPAGGRTAAARVRAGAPPAAVASPGPGRAGVDADADAITLVLEGVACAATGALTVRVCAPASARNWAGVPLAFAVGDGAGFGDGGDGSASSPAPPAAAWVPAVGGGSAPVRAAAPAAQRVASRQALDGLGHALGDGGGSSASLASEGGEGAALPGPSLLPAPPSLGRRVPVRLRTSHAPPIPGRSPWSAPAWFDAATGGAAVVAVPAPGLRRASTAGADRGTVAPADAAAPLGAYMVALAAAPAPGGGLALTTAPRFVARSDVEPGGPDLQFIQDGAPPDAARPLPPGACRVVHWHDARRPLRLRLRPREAGWAWSGALDPALPGDALLRVRSREGAPARLLRVTVADVGSGCLAAAAAFVGDGFAPYRVDNCSPLELRLRQVGARDEPAAPDVVRPWSAAPYAWGDPRGERVLAVALADGARVGAFALDAVSAPFTVVLPASSGGCVLRVGVAADGPLRVLSVVDARVHVPPRSLAPSPLPATHPAAVPWSPWSGPPAPLRAAAAAALGVGGAGAAGAAARSDAVPPRGWLACVTLRGVGLSMVDGRELAYARATRLQARCGADGARVWGEAALARLQLDDAKLDARHRVAFLAPAPAGGALAGLGSAAAGGGPAPAARARLAVWLRRPGGVLCVDLADVALAPCVLDVDVAAATALAGEVRRGLAAAAGGERAALPPPPPDAGPWANLDAPAPEPELKVYADRVRVGGLVAWVSIHPAATAPARRGLPAAAVAARARGRDRARAIAALLGEVEGARLAAAPLALDHPLLASSALRAALAAHYARAALPQIVRLVGAASVLGDPLGLVHHLGLSLWALAAAPVAGVAAGARAGGGPAAAASRLTAGVTDAARHAAYALSNAAAKGAAAARRALDAAGVVAPTPAGGDNGLLAALAAGVAGIVAEPVRGADAGGVAGGIAGAAVGAARGAVRGVVAAAAGPAAAALDGAAALAASVRSAVVGDRTLHRVRPPRAAAPGAPLPPYDWREAAGRELLAELGQDKEEYVACVAAGGGLALVTSARILLAPGDRAPRPRSPSWQAAAGDVLAVARTGTKVVFLALAPAAGVKVRSARRAAAGPLASASAAAASAADAAFLATAADAAAAAARATGAVVVTRAAVGWIEKREEEEGG